jgi:N-acetylglucosaminyl-diphospho-decaprenol L-rhamnosyltransferase
MPPDLTVIIVSYNTEHLLDRMFESLDESRGSLEIQFIVVDNASRDGSVQLLRTKYPDVELIENKSNVGFGRANNQALALVRGRYVLLLNTDAFLSPDTLVKSLAFMDAHQQCGVLGVTLVGVDDSLQPSCRYFPTPWNVFLQSTGLARLFPSARLVDDMTWDHKSERECDWVPGCFYLIRREVIEHVGLFDPRYFLYWEEIDHCRAVRSAGWSVIYFPHTKVVHIGGESAASDGTLEGGSRQLNVLQLESSLLYFRKHYGIQGVFEAVFFKILGEVIFSAKALAGRLDMKRTVSAFWNVFVLIKVLVNTRLASVPTR